LKSNGKKANLDSPATNLSVNGVLPDEMTNVVRFLDLIGIYCEGTTSPPSVNNGYDRIVNGVHGASVFTNYVHHPFTGGIPPVLVVAPGSRFPNGLRSDAAGRYQFMLKTWIALATALKLPDFSPKSQDLAAIELMRERGSLAHLQNGSIALALAAHMQPSDLEVAVEDSSTIWASFPGNSYGQGGKTMQQILADWDKLVSASTSTQVV
jgi:muramidase (phage lysozyme)